MSNLISCWIIRLIYLIFYSNFPKNNVILIDNSIDIMELNVRELGLDDIHYIADYWDSCSPEFLYGMGVEISKMPGRQEFVEMLTTQTGLPYSEKEVYALIWEIDGVPVGHTNINQIIFGEKATMHLHLWSPAIRKKGIGSELVRKSLPFYFENFKLNVLRCEPYCLNPAPNRVLKKVGFDFIKKYKTIPGPINFDQEVNLHHFTRQKYREQFE